MEKLLHNFPELRIDLNRKKVCCCLTGHEMPMKEDAVQSFVKGNRFRKAKEKREFCCDEFPPHLVANTKKRLDHISEYPSARRKFFMSWVKFFGAFEEVSFAPDAPVGARFFKQHLFCTLTHSTVAKRLVDVDRHINGKRYQRALKRWEQCQLTGETFTAHHRKGHSNDAHFHAQHDVATTNKKDSDTHDNLADLYPEYDCDASNIDVGFDHNTLSEDGLTDIDEVGCIQADGDVSVDVSTSSSVSRVVVSKKRKHTIRLSEKKQLPKKKKIKSSNLI